MNKKIISLVLALVMVLGTFTSVFAAETKKEEAKKPEASEKVEKIVGKDNKIQYIIDKKLVEGYEDGSYGLDKNIKRSEITRLLVLANGNEDIAKKLQGAMKIYSDVDTKHWANGVISVGTTVPSDANGIAMLAGYPDGSFKPENDVTYAELAKMLVVLAKKDLTADMVKNAVWATSWMTWAAQLGILDDVDYKDSNKAANRADAFTMIYNALYKMQEFKRVPANETRGIISNFSKDVLTLNQDSKMEYKITDATVFVTGMNATRQQVQQIRFLDLKVRDYYLGSLVRVLTNDKNEVTHIIELGNPAELAKGNPTGMAVGNDIWRGVADNTVETINPVAKSAVEAQKAIKAGDSYATIEFNANNIDAKRIVFHNINKVDKNLTLKINDKTEFYVANPANNQMKKVANVNEALALIGFHNYNNYKIVGVYAGFDTDGITRNYGAIQVDTADRHTAKVVVFNFVNKSASGEKYRVIESSSSKFMTTLEKTDGTLVDRDNVYDTSRFPLEYGDKLDVIELDTVRTGSFYATLIDHSKTSVFPIVRITDVREDGKVIYIEDKNGERSMLDLRDADIFSAKRYGKVEVGNTLQFRVEDFGKSQVYAQAANNTAEIISLLGKDMKLEGSLVNVIPAADKSQEVGRIISIQGIDTVNPTVTVRVDYNIFDAADASGYATYSVSNDVAKALDAWFRAYPTRRVDFKVFESVNAHGQHYAVNFHDNETGAAILYTAEKTNIDLLVEKAKVAAKDFRIVNEYNLKNAKALEAEIKGLEDSMSAGQKVLWADAKYNAPKADIQALRDAIQAQTKINLQAKIDEAKAKVKDVKPSVDGKDVAPTEMWAPQADIDALNTAITTAEGELTKTTEEMEKAINALQVAMDKFVAKAGTKTA
ncbi:S-layer homology domain-containing protein [Peptoniphilus grossensis]|uniref:S-layer homology domain-containing protein n=1 Tax=Peptoniphilus grossensis TaxID=1465756 RepID=UPI00399BC69E